jgi:hypothetical protein
MNRLTVTVERRDGTREEFPIYPSAILAFERQTKGSMSRAFSTEHPNMSDLYLVAYLAEKDSGTVVKIFDEYVKQLAHVEVGTSPKD